MAARLQVRSRAGTNARSAGARARRHHTRSLQVRHSLALAAAGLSLAGARDFKDGGGLNLTPPFLLSSRLGNTNGAAWCASALDALALAAGSRLACARRCRIVARWRSRLQGRRRAEPHAAVSTFKPSWKYKRRRQVRERAGCTRARCRIAARSRSPLQDRRSLALATSRTTAGCNLTPSFLLSSRLGESNGAARCCPAPSLEPRAQASGEPGSERECVQRAHAPAARAIGSGARANLQRAQLVPVRPGCVTLLLDESHTNNSPYSRSGGMAARSLAAIGRAAGPDYQRAARKGERTRRPQTIHATGRHGEGVA